MANDDKPIDSPEAISEMRRRHLTMALMMQGVAAAAVRELQQKIDQRLPLDVTMDDARALMDAGLKLERQSQPTQHGPLRPAGKPQRKG